MKTDWIMTSTGIPFWPLEPRVDDVRIEDIAHALAAMNRFNGHTREPYSVAHHSVLVSLELERAMVSDGPGEWVEPALYGLLHDASEAYLCDVPRPLKRDPVFAAYRDAEARLQAVIYQAFGLDPDAEPADLGLIDRRMLRTEQKHLMPPAALDERRDDAETFPIIIRPWGAAHAKACFLHRFADLQSWREARAS